jgi:hypothetical protein
MDFKGEITRGGYDVHTHFIVATVGEMHAIPVELLKVGVSCRVPSDGTNPSVVFVWDGTQWVQVESNYTQVFSTSFQTSNIFDFDITITDTEKDTVFAVLTLRGVKDGSYGGISLYMPKNMHYRIEAAPKDGYTTPEPVTGTVPAAGGSASLYFNYAGCRLYIHNSRAKPAQVTVTDMDSDTVMFKTNFGQWNARETILPIGINYKVTADYGDDDVLEYTGVATEFGREITLTVPSSSIYFYNQTEYKATITVYNDDTGVAIAPKFIASPNSNISAGPFEYSEPFRYRAEIVLDDEDETSITKKNMIDSNQGISIMKENYTLQVLNQMSYAGTFRVTDTDTNEVLGEVTLKNYERKDYPLRIKTNYKVELLPVESLGIEGDVFTGQAIIPEGYNNSYVRQVSLYYSSANVNSLYVGFSYVQYQVYPEIGFRIKKAADDTVIYTGVLKDSGSLYYPVPRGLILKVEFDVDPNYSIPPEVTVTVPSTSSSASATCSIYYCLFRISNTSPVEMAYTITDTDTDGVIHSGTLLSSYASDYLPVRPGTNYRIDYGNVEGYVTPASETGTAGNNTTVEKSPVYVVEA